MDSMDYLPVDVTQSKIQNTENAQWISWQPLGEWMFNYYVGVLVLAAPFSTLQQNFKL